MPNRTEILHFRATPEEKETIRENAGHAELALSEWMRQRSLDYPRRAREAVQRFTTQPQFECCGGPNETGKHLEGCPRCMQEEVEASYHDKRLARRLRDEEFRAEYNRTLDCETYGQFMERRTRELEGDDAGPKAEAEAWDAADAEWNAR